jgi:hypothetical protein
MLSVHNICHPCRLFFVPTKHEQFWWLRALDNGTIRVLRTLPQTGMQQKPHAKKGDEDRYTLFGRGRARVDRARGRHR